MDILSCIIFLPKVLSAYSDEIVHLFRLIPSTGSEDNRPVVPKQIGQVVGAKRRWYFGYVSEFLS